MLREGAMSADIGRPEGCGFGPCRNSIERGGQGCRLCDVIAKLPQPKALEAVKEQDNPERDGAPKLAGERKRGNLAFQKRHREGPHRGNA
jgi:hypothetical protein